MEWISDAPVWVVAAAVFLLRIVDVSLGTVRVILVVNGHKWLAAFLGFFEVLIWLAAISQVLLSVRQYPALMLAYAGGFAAGNVVGVVLERELGMGRAVALLISRDKGEEVAHQLRSLGHRLTTILGEGRDGPRQIVYATVRRRAVPRIIRTAREIDPDLFYVVHPCSETSLATRLQSSIGLRSLRTRK